jgi:23S rRNA (guanine745-N1)-methyltransferase
MLGMPAAVACTVRGCGDALARERQRWLCPRGHSYDVARAGYINLLQPQDRRSSAAGDSGEAVAARARLLDAGIGAAPIAAIVEDVLSTQVDGVPQVADLGCGTGHLLAALAARQEIDGVGIDLSVAAAEYAARRHPALTWLVANADRRLPLPDASTAIVLSLHGRRNPRDCARVLAPGGTLIVAVPAADDLTELRATLHGDVAARDRVEALIRDHAGLEPVSRRTVSARHELDAAQLRDLLAITYRGARHQQLPAVEALRPMAVTLASDIVRFVRRVDAASH